MALGEDISAPDSVTREALTWVERLRTGRMTVAEGNELRSWRQQSPAHAQAFAEAAVLSRLVREAATDIIAAPADMRQRQPIFMQRRAFIGGLAAASVVVVSYAAVKPPLDLWPSLGEIASNLKSDYTTGVGEQKTIRVADATVELNTRSGLALLGKRPVPGVELIDGEMMVDVNHSPFAVKAGVGTLTTQQSRFNIRFDGDSICVTCVSGTGQLGHPRATVTLAPGQQLIYSTMEISKPWPVNVAIATAWHRGMLTFHDEMLGDVVAEINRYRTGKIVILRKSLAQKRVYASIHLNKIDTIVDQLQQFSHGRVYSVGNVVFLV